MSCKLNVYYNSSRHIQKKNNEAHIICVFKRQTFYLELLTFDGPFFIDDDSGYDHVLNLSKETQTLESYSL